MGDEFIGCDATEDGGCFFRGRIDELEAEVRRLREELAARPAQAPAWWSSSKLAETVAALVKAGREVAMIHARYELETLVDDAHLHLDDAVFELKRAMEPFEGE